MNVEITHTWQITRLIQKNDDSGVVTDIFYKVYSTDNLNYYVTGGSVKLDTENILDFIPYENLTEELVLSWVRDSLGPELGDHEKINSEMIESLTNPPPKLSKIDSLPWIPEPIPSPEPTPTPDPEPSPEPSLDAVPFGG